MPNFDYITDDGFRQSLQSDWQELQAAHQAKAWKAVHVLAGSIIEAAMIDYLGAASLPLPRPDLLRLSFKELVQLCTGQKIISAQTADLSSVVREYRNLIHPGKVARTGEHVTEDSATVARSLVEILVGELETGKTKFQGYTAKQLLSKLLKDHTSLAILPHLLEGMSSSERRRLVLATIPEAYMQMMGPMADEAPDFHSTEILKRCYRLVLDSASADIKQLAAEGYVSILKSQSGEYIETYELAFFRGDDLGHVINPLDQEMVKTRLMDRLKATPSVGRLSTVRGLFSFLTEEQAYDTAYQLLHSIANDKPQGISAEASQLLISESVFLKEVLGAKVKECVQLWAKHAEEKKLIDVQRRLANVRSSILGEPLFTDDDIPL